MRRRGGAKVASPRFEDVVSVFGRLLYELIMQVYWETYGQQVKSQWYHNRTTDALWCLFTTSDLGCTQKLRSIVGIHQCWQPSKTSRSVNSTGG